MKDVFSDILDYFEKVRRSGVYPTIYLENWIEGAEVKFILPVISQGVLPSEESITLLEVDFSYSKLRIIIDIRYTLNVVIRFIGDEKKYRIISSFPEGRIPPDIGVLFRTQYHLRSGESGCKLYLSPYHYFIDTEYEIMMKDELISVKDEILYGENPLGKAFSIWKKVLSTRNRDEIEAVRRILSSWLILRYNKDIFDRIAEMFEEIMRVMTPPDKMLLLLEKTVEITNMLKLIE